MGCQAGCEVGVSSRCLNPSRASVELRRERARERERCGKRKSSTCPARHLRYPQYADGSDWLSNAKPTPTYQIYLDYGNFHTARQAAEGREYSPSRWARQRQGLAANDARCVIWPSINRSKKWASGEGKATLGISVTIEFPLWLLGRTPQREQVHPSWCMWVSLPRS